MNEPGSKYHRTASATNNCISNETTSPGQPNTSSNGYYLETSTMPDELSCNNRTSISAPCTTATTTAATTTTTTATSRPSYITSNYQAHQAQALPSYFYNSKLRPGLNSLQNQTSICSSVGGNNANNNTNTNYTDDFEELEDDETNKRGNVVLAGARRMLTMQNVRKASFSSTTTTASSVSSNGCEEGDGRMDGAGRGRARSKNNNSSSSSSSSTAASPNRSRSSLSIDSTTLALKKNIEVKILPKIVSLLGF